MKKIVAVLFVVISIGIVAFAFFQSPKEAGEEFLRIHIRANSDSVIDQNVKYKVKDAVVNGLTPLFSNITTREEALQAISNNLDYVEKIASKVISENGFEYSVNAKLSFDEYFPTRSYNDLTLDEGFYDALILELGEAKGQNWWCVVYPPLCFLENNIGGEAGIRYKSKLQEIIDKIF